MDRDALIRTATEYAQSQGRDMTRYTASSVREQGDTVRVHFDGDSATVGNHFSVTIERSTGRAVRLMPGR
jgi:hypothetical protein